MASKAPRIDRRKWYRLLDYTPRLGQQLMDEAADSGKRVLCLFTFPQFGKSYGVAKSVEPSLLLENTHGWIVGSTYQDAVKEFEYLWKDFGATGLLKLAERKSFDLRGGNMVIEFPWGSWVRVVSADNEDNLRREQLDWVILAEASKLGANVYDRNIHARLSIRKGKLYVPTTPRGHNWIFDRFRVPSLPVKPGTFAYGPWQGQRRQMVGGESNPAYDPACWSVVVSATPEYGDVWETGVHDADELARAKRTMPPQIFAEQYGGDFASYAGLIYQFDPSKHEVEPFEIPTHWPVVVGWDHGAGGGSDPTVITIRSVAPDGTSYYWGEIYDDRARTTRDRVQLLRVKLGNHLLAYPIMRGHDAKQIGTELAECGIPSTHPDVSLVLGRIMRVTDRLGDGKLKLLRGRMPRVKQGFLSYEWDETKPKQPRDGQDDHALESLGYNELAPIAATPVKAPDPYAHEPAAVRAEWKDFRERMQEQEDRRMLAQIDRILTDDPYDVADGRIHYISAR